MSKDLIIKHLKSNGLKMSKCINVGGIFTYPTYDRRTVYTLEDMYKLNKEGFTIDSNVGIWLLNALLNEENE